MTDIINRPICGLRSLSSLLSCNHDTTTRAANLNVRAQSASCVMRGQTFDILSLFFPHHTFLTPTEVYQVMRWETVDERSSVPKCVFCFVFYSNPKHTLTLRCLHVVSKPRLVGHFLLNTTEWSALSSSQWKTNTFYHTRNKCLQLSTLTEKHGCKILKIMNILNKQYISLNPVFSRGNEFSLNLR